MLQAPLATRHRIKSIECLVPQDDDNGRAQRYLAWLGRGLDTLYHAWRRADDERRLRHLYSEKPRQDLDVVARLKQGSWKPIRSADIVTRDDDGWN